MYGVLWNAQTESILKLDAEMVPVKQIMKITGVKYSTVHSILFRYRLRYLIYTRGESVIGAIKDSKLSISDLSTSLKVHPKLIREIQAASNEELSKEIEYVKTHKDNTQEKLSVNTYDYRCPICGGTSKQTSFSLVICPHCRNNHAYLNRK